MTAHGPLATLSPVERKFILDWGEIGTRWGVNRTVAQVHALLYLSPAPLNADDLVAALGVARSNINLYDFFAATTAWYDTVRRWPTAAVLKFMKTGDRVLKRLGIAG